MGQSSNSFYWIMFRWHCKSDHLMELYNHFKNKLQWDDKYLLQIGMDGPKVNISFLNKLKEEFNLKYPGKNILDIGSCNLHKIHNAFKSSLECIKFDINELCQNLYFSLKFPTRREDYKLSSLETDIETHFMLRFVETRWLSLGTICERILEQFENLKKFFLDYMTKNNDYKSAIKQDRYTNN